MPPINRGTVFIIHGYFDHSGIQKHLIRCCLDHRLAVALFDLPGHGLSSGKRASIKDFGDYVRIFQNFLNRCRPHLPRPYYLMGHSTGGAVVIDFLLNPDPKIQSDGSQIERAILLAPLVRSAWWNMSKIGHFLIGSIADSVPRSNKANSTDPSFVRFLRNDPLQHDRVPIEWINALFAWNERVSAFSKNPIPVLILQGSSDSVVDWRFNIPFLQKKFPTAQVKMFKSAKHHLANETETIRLKVLDTVSAFLHK